MLSVKIWRPGTGEEGYIVWIDFSPLSTKYRVTNIDGIDYVDSNILSDKVSQHYGSIYRGWSVADREITIDIAILGDIKANRRNLLSFFNTRGIYRIELIDGVHDIADPLDLPELSLAWINGYVRAIDYQTFSNRETIKLTFICPYPYFTRLKATSSAAMAMQVLFGIPFTESAYQAGFFSMGLSVRGGMVGVFGTDSAGKQTIVMSPDNIGDVEAGFIFVTQLYNSGTIKIGQLTTANLNPGIIIIDTRPTYKAVYSYESGVITRLSNKIAAPSKWPLLQRGSNNIEVTLPVPTSGSTRTYGLLSHAPEYEGI